VIGKQKAFLIAFEIFCLVLVDLRVYAIVVRNENIAEILK
jgi:hypothetical protein